MILHQKPINSKMPRTFTTHGRHIAASFCLWICVPYSRSTVLVMLPSEIISLQGHRECVDDVVFSGISVDGVEGCHSRVDTACVKGMQVMPG